MDMEVVRVSTEAISVWVRLSGGNTKLYQSVADRVQRIISRRLWEQEIPVKADIGSSQRLYPSMIPVHFFSDRNGEDIAMSLEHAKEMVTESIREAIEELKI